MQHHEINREDRRARIGGPCRAAIGAALIAATLAGAASGARAGAGPGLWNEPEPCQAAPGVAPSDPACAGDQLVIGSPTFTGDGNIFAFAPIAGGVNRMALGTETRANSVLGRAIFLGFYRPPPGPWSASPPGRAIEAYADADFLTFDVPGASGSAAISLTGFVPLESIVAPAIYGVDAPAKPRRATEMNWPPGNCGAAAGGGAC